MRKLRSTGNVDFGAQIKKSGGNLIFKNVFSFYLHKSQHLNDLCVSWHMVVNVMFVSLNGSITTPLRTRKKWIIDVMTI